MYAEAVEKRIENFFNNRPTIKRQLYGNCLIRDKNTIRQRNNANNSSPIQNF